MQALVAFDAFVFCFHATLASLAKLRSVTLRVVIHAVGSYFTVDTLFDSAIEDDRLAYQFSGSILLQIDLAHFTSEL